MQRPANSWVERENKEKADKALVNKVIAAFWQARVIEGSEPERIDSFKNFLKYCDPTRTDEIDIVFKTSIEQKDYDYFERVVQEILTPQDAVMVDKAHGYGITALPEKKVDRISLSDINNLKEYLVQTGLSAVVSIGNSESKEFQTVTSIDIPSSLPFAIHSVGKLFTGVLVLELINRGIISDEHLNKPIKEFLHFAEPKPHPEFLNKKKYSNIGITLVGLAIEHAHHQAYPNEIPPLDFFQILHKYILQDAGISPSHFFNDASDKQAQVRFNKKDQTAPYIAGGPAGCSWTPVEDLSRFAKWLYEHCQQTQFMNLVRKFGQEFYSESLCTRQNFDGLIVNVPACVPVPVFSPNFL